MALQIRREREDDLLGIRQVVDAAFAAKSHLDHKENKIIDRLRHSNALSVSLVAVQDEVIVGYIAVSPITIRTESSETVNGWYGGGPLAVRPEFHGKGVGTRLVYAARDELSKLGARGCVSLGIPEYYEQFGFERDDGLKFEAAPQKVFRRILLNGEAVRGVVRYHEAWDV